MTEQAGGSSGQCFEARYRRDPDPWNFATSSYEQGRYRAILQALMRPRYDTAFEPGCSVGELTAGLAPRCRRVIATDIAPSAAARARQRCASFENVEIHCANLLEFVPTASLDLVVFSEIGYYFTIPALEELARALARRLPPGGELIAAHWLGHSADHVLHGDTVHETLFSVLPLTWIKGHRGSEFRIDTWAAS